MKWDRKLKTFAVCVLLLILSAAGILLFYSGQRIRSAAEEGCRLLLERLARTDNIFRVNVNRRGKFESQLPYRNFNPAWLKELSYVPGEFLDSEVVFTHTVSFRLKSYDTENVYSHRDSPTAYTRYDDEVIMRKNGDYYYVDFLTAGTEYHFLASCAPMTSWLDGIAE